MSLKLKMGDEDDMKQITQLAELLARK